MPAKIVVTAHRGGSRVALVGTSGKELLSSQVFHEPRAKGATVRSLKALLGDDVKVEDHTLAGTAPVAKVAKVTANGAHEPDVIAVETPKPRSNGRSPAKKARAATR